MRDGQRQKTGDHRLVAKRWKPEEGDARQKDEDRRRGQGTGEAGDGRRETGNRRQEAQKS